MLASACLAAVKILIGWIAGSTAVVSDGFESAGDVLTSSAVLAGLIVASRPPDENHPYGHGRIETLTGLGVGIVLASAGVLIAANAISRIGQAVEIPKAYAIWPLLASIAIKSVLSVTKLRVGRRIQSEALMADAWNDAVDILSGVVAMAALGLTLLNPDHLGSADRWGGFAVGVIIVFTGLRVIRDTSMQLMDTMPPPALLDEIRRIALTVPGVLGVEKLFARKTGFQYHVDLHLEVDPDITVRASHDIATNVRFELRNKLDWVADVLVHVEPAPLYERDADTMV